MKLSEKAIRKLFLILIVSILFLPGCRDEVEISGYFSFSDFETRKVCLDDIEYSPAMLDTWSSSLQLSGNSVFILSPRSADKLVTRFDFETGDKQMLVPRGRGPGELLGIRGIFVMDETLFVIDNNERKIISYVCSPSDSLVYDSSLSLDTYYHRVVPIPGGGYLGSPMTDGRFCLISPEGKSGEPFGSFMPVKGPREAVNSMALQTLVAFSPDGSHMCSAYQDADCIEFYDRDLNLTRRLIGPERRIPEVKKWEGNEGYGYTTTPMYKEYMGICGKEDGVYVGYVGYERKKGDPDRGLNSILFFDWEGNCKIRYLLPFELDAFDIDADNRLVGVTFDYEHPQLVRFPLP